jgi:hypothetical protein
MPQLGSSLEEKSNAATEFKNGEPKEAFNLRNINTKSLIL